MRPVRGTEAHLTDSLAELVCSNSFRSDDAQNNAVGVIHEEMRRAGSLIMRAADTHKLPAGGALAVDRHGFSAAVQEALLAHPLVTLQREEVAGLPPADWGSTIIATGPLTSSALAEALARETGEDSLAFFDAIAPIVHHDSIDQSIAWKQSRYDKQGPGGGTADYINCPLDKEQYDAFVASLLAGDKTEFKQWEASTPYFQGCQPIEVIAASGPQSLRFGPMKPVGLRDPRTGTRPWAVVQLGQDNAEFARLGGLHRNTFLNSPRLLDATLRLKALPRLRFAGQITGCEGYVESAAIGLLAGRFAAAERRGETLVPPPPTTAHGALLAHIVGGHLQTTEDEHASARSYQPMNVNFGLFPPLAAGTRGENGERLRGPAKTLAKK